MKYLLALVALLAAAPAMAQTTAPPKDDCMAQCIKQQEKVCHAHCKGQEDETGCYYDCMEPASDICEDSCKNPKDQSPHENRN